MNMNVWGEVDVTGALFENLGRDGNRGVDWVGDDGHPRLWAVLGNGHAQIPHNACTDPKVLSHCTLHDRSNLTTLLKILLLNALSQKAVQSSQDHKLLQRTRSLNSS